MSFLYSLDTLAHDDDKIILINVNQENDFFDDGFVCNEIIHICLDNLDHIHVQKYIKEVDGAIITATTNLDSFVDENCKFSNILADIIVKLTSIEQISYQKVVKYWNYFWELRFLDKEFMTYLIK